MSNRFHFNTDKFLFVRSECIHFDQTVFFCMISAMFNWLNTEYGNNAALRKVKGSKWYSMSKIKTPIIQQKQKMQHTHTHPKTHCICLICNNIFRFLGHLHFFVAIATISMHAYARERERSVISVSGRGLLFIDKLLLCTGFVDDRSNRLQLIRSKCDMHKN